MQSIMISIQPVWVEKILNGEKTVEVRKSKPKLQVPFKCYIYETQGHTDTPWIDEDGHCIFKGRGEVVAEFTCCGVDYIGNIATDKWELLQGNVHEQHKRLISKNACLTEQQCLAYGGKYAWHISDLMVYDKPKELSEFYTERVTTIDYPKLRKMNRPPQSWCYVEGRRNKIEIQCRG